MKIAMTTLSSKILSQDKEHFAQLAVDAVMRLKVNAHSFCIYCDLGENYLLTSLIASLNTMMFIAAI